MLYRPVTKGIGPTQGTEHLPRWRVEQTDMRGEDKGELGRGAAEHPFPSNARQQHLPGVAATVGFKEFKGAELYDS